MPSIKDMISIIEATPSNQAILLEGIHGIGKSQCIESHFKKLGYKMVTLFLGQMADAGDVIGLPDRQDNEETGYKHTIFCPPFWWPKDDEEKFILFLDELNRGKPEVMQCIMDMVLNRKLMGKRLPKNCKIIGAMNPLTEDGYYQVDELDPAFLDRWNRYDFQPTSEEWLDWAYKVKINKHVIGFIHKNLDQLDPMTNVKEGAKANDIQPSRRSWERVSDFFNANSDLENEEELMQKIMFGIVGPTATSRFKAFIRENRKGLHAGYMLTNWNRDIEHKVKTMEFQDTINFNRQIAFWFQEHEDDIKLDKKLAATTINNLSKYLSHVGNESEANFFSIIANDNLQHKTYARMIIRLNKAITERFFKTLNESYDT